MSKVYIIFNLDTGQPECVTKDKQLAQEYLCDYFMNDVLYEWYWAQQYDKDFNPKHDARDIWYANLDWYNTYVEIFESEVF